MLFIYNTTKNNLELRAVGDGDDTVLKLFFPDSTATGVTVLTAGAHTPKAAEELNRSYKNGFAITNKLTKRNILVRKKTMFYDSLVSEYIEIDADDQEARNLYRQYPRNVLLVVTGVDGSVEYRDSNVSRRGVEYIVEDEKGNAIAKVTKIFVRWSNWSKLKYPVVFTVHDNGGTTYLKASFREVESKTKPGSRYNTNVLIESTENPAPKTKNNGEKKERPKHSNPYNNNNKDRRPRENGHGHYQKSENHRNGKRR